MDGWHLTARRFINTGPSKEIGGTAGACAEDKEPTSFDGWIKTDKLSTCPKPCFGLAIAQRKVFGCAFFQKGAVL